MTQRTLVVLQDDIDGSEPAQTVRFSVQGRTYEIDLNDEHLGEFERVLAPWVARARRGGVRALPGPRTEADWYRDPDPAEIRRWAAEQGFPVHARGRLPDHVRMQYLRAREEIEDEEQAG